MSSYNSDVQVYEHAHKLHHYLHGTNAFDAHIYGNGMPEEFFFMLIELGFGLYFRYYINLVSTSGTSVHQFGLYLRYYCTYISLVFTSGTASLWSPPQVLHHFGLYLRPLTQLISA